jgi:hypothetical protein
VIEFPTNLATIVGRWACDGPADLEAVRALQRGLTLEPFGAPALATGLPVPAAVPDELAFFEQLRTCRHASYLARALTARGGLWGNHGYEAAYPMTYTDADGDQLDGRNRYTLTFDQDPPVDAFWSITMYDLPDFYLVANPIGRYSIGDRTPGLRRGADGSLTIVIQHEPPADTSNWLPAPAAPFRPVMRLYQPRPAILRRRTERRPPPS